MGLVSTETGPFFVARKVTRLDIEEARAFERTRELVSGALRKRLNPSPSNDGPWGPYVTQTFDDRVVYEWSGKMWQSDYTIAVANGESTVTFGDQVEVEVSYAPIGEAADTAIDGDFIALQEAVRADGTVQLKIIQPGWGSSGYYSEQMLKRDGPKVFKAGLKSYWNHPTVSEAQERPERDLRDLAAELVSDARWMKNGPAGAGLYADAKVFESYAPVVEELAPHIGVSIRANGRVKEGEAEGRKGRIIEKLVSAMSVDFVTEPGAGGRVVQLFEAAGRSAPEEDEMDEAKVQELIKEAMAPLQTQLGETRTALEAATTENTRLREGLVLRDAREFATSQLAASQLPDMTKARLVERLAANPPVKDGALDRDAFKAVIETAVKEEADYLSRVTGSPVRGMGVSESKDDDEWDAEKAEAARVERYKRLGLSESAAKVAAVGRN